MKYGLLFVALLVAVIEVNGHSSDVCSQPKRTGHCFALFRKWHYNSATSSCEQFVYGGCGGNGNRFNTKEECEARCPGNTNDNQNNNNDDSIESDEEEEVQVAITQRKNKCRNRVCYNRCPFGRVTSRRGCPTCRCRPNPCHNMPPCDLDCRYGYMKHGNGCPKCQCKPAPVCPPLPSCQVQCPFGKEKDADGCTTCTCKVRPAAPLLQAYCGDRPRCRMRCRNGYQRDENGCAICRCLRPVTPADACSEPKVAGMCRGYFPSWFFNSKTQQCEEFIYGGCGGNNNRFRSQAACQSRCSTD